MERHIEIFLKRLFYVAILIDTVTFVFILLKTPDTCVAPGSSPKPHFCFPKSSCDVSSHQSCWGLGDDRKSNDSIGRGVRVRGFLRTHEGLKVE
ncbi:hypothetical protein ACFX2J_014247 [Malus domestica]